MQVRHVAFTVWMAAVLCVALAPGAAFAQADKPQVKVGVLPFVDATGTGNAGTGAALGRLVQAEIVHSTELLGRVLPADGTNPEDIDVEKAAAIGKGHNVDLVLIGTVLEAKSESSSKGANTGRLFGQSVGATMHKSKATVQLQGDIVDVATGRRLTSLRVKGEESDTKVGANAWTQLGGLSTDSNAWLESPIGQAMQKAVADLVKRVNAEAAKR